VNLDQTRATKAFEHICGIRDDTSTDKVFRDRYGTLALKLPALVRTAGLCQAVHFVHSRAKGDAKKCPEMHILGHLAKQLKRVDPTIEDADSLCKSARTAGMREYLHLTREAIATLQWYARLSKSVLDIDVTDVLEGE
jgi:CRISPR-associated protein Cmr5